MKNNLLIGFLLLFSSVVFAQKQYAKNYHTNGNLKEEGWVKDNLKHGYWKFYYPNGVLKEKGHFKKGLKHKYWYFYRADSFKEKEGHYINGLQNKWWLFYDNNGDVGHKCQLKNNIKNGYCLVYQKRKLVKASKFVNGKKIKEWKDFSSFKKENNLNDLK
ncbi:toxin-antitoxin system YwqK family antitoxin [Tenacibaculum amylolyticum]|uniref:toxin-antitoxin system YwqK family antitoxin n=1 Tax=Tenacibaculum amylolyticum TaxID=104269 RepID=UPI003893759D